MKVPQAFTHLALINAVMHVIAAERDRRLMATLSPRVRAAHPAASPTPRHLTAR